MSTANETLVRSAYAAYEQGEVTALLGMVDPTWSGPISIRAKRTPNRGSATVEASWRSPCSGSSGGV
jgi:hypothetical protein